MKEYNCPDCNIETNSCNGCPRVEKQYVDNKTEIDWSKFNISSYSIPDLCKYCKTHPSNGGDGICWCVLGSCHITC